jgi:hypothetical protein
MYLKYCILNYVIVFCVFYARFGVRSWSEFGFRDTVSEHVVSILYICST